MQLLDVAQLSDVAATALSIPNFMKSGILAVLMVCLVHGATAAQIGSRKLQTDFGSQIQALRASLEAKLQGETEQLMESLDKIENMRDQVRRVAQATGGPSIYPSPPSAGVYPPMYFGASNPGADGTIQPDDPIVIPTPSSFRMVLDASYDEVIAVLAAFTVDTQNAISRGLGISPSRVAITRISPGSVIVDFKLLFDNTISSVDIEAMTVRLVSSPDGVLTPEYLTKYGATSATLTQIGSTDAGRDLYAPPPSPGAASLALVNVAMSVMLALLAVMMSCL
eukprot:gene32256-16823_t